jgi:hypothetical protein
MPMDREPDADATLVELLYGELDGADRDRAEARVAADPALASELDGLRALRGTLRIWGEASDAEPPGDLSALLAAARASARPAAVAAEPATPGLWERLSRWMAPLLAHPGLAAAATLVLVAGVAGTLYVTGGSRMAEPTAAPAQDQAPSELAIAPEPAPPREAPAAAAPATISEESAAPGGAASGGAVADKRERAESKASAPDKPKERRKRQAAEPMDDADAEGAAAGTAGGEAFESEAAPPARDEAVAPTQAPAAAPPPPAKAPPPAPRPSSSAGDTAEPASPGAGDLARLTREARDAAARGDCARVRALSERVRALDAAYHVRSFRGDKAIAPCLAATKL